MLSLRAMGAAAALLLGLAGAAQGQIALPPGFDDKPGARDYARLLQVLTKPAGPAASGDDSCQYANDGECDEPEFGTGACRSGTDRSDCWRIMTGQEDDSCEWSGDGECDEPGFGTGACTQGTDRTDCGDVTALRFRNDSCATAFDGVCDEPQGTGLCAARTDRSDCAGRARPLTINDHFFGRDDRVLVDTAAFPWRVIGTISLDVGGTCTASLVARDVLVTAAHCISEDGRINAAGEFVTGAALPGGPRRARVIDFHMDPDWDEQAFSDGDTRDGTDWALLRLDRPLGDELGHLGVYAPGRTGWGELRAAQVRQAGYSWDTGENLSGNLDCRVREIFPDNTLAHDCDTTRGDSGSPFIVDTPDGPAVIATDSNFRSNPDGPFIYIAARADRWIEALPAFAAGQLGAGGVRPAGPGKPGPLSPVKEG